MPAMRKYQVQVMLESSNKPGPKDQDNLNTRGCAYYDTSSCYKIVMDKTMKRILYIIIIALFPAATAWAAVGDTFTENNLKYKVTGEAPKTADVTGYQTKPKGNLEIPATANGYTVTGIAKNAFRNCTGLKSVVIAEGITTIGEGAFGYCDGMTSVSIPEGVTTIGKNAFYDCEALTSVTIPNSVTSIGNGAFSFNLGLESVTIPEGVTSIGNEAFSGCYVLTEVSIPASVTSIGSKAFESCKALTEVNIYANKLTGYGSDAFKNANASLEINVFSDNVAAFQKGWADYSSQIAAFTHEDLTVTGVTANQNPGETSEYWVTYYHPAANTKITSDDVEIYIATLAEENGYVNLTQVEGNIIKAGQAVMLKAASADALAMELTPDAATGDYNGNDLKGGSTVATDKVAYTLAAKNGRMGFYKFAGSALNPGKAHLELPSLAASVHEFIALDEETVTSINVNVNDNPNDDAWYDLNGSRVQKFKGSSINGKPSTVNGKPRIYIHNGRKEAVR